MTSSRKTIQYIDDLLDGENYDSLISQPNGTFVDKIYSLFLRRRPADSESEKAVARLTAGTPKQDLLIEALTSWESAAWLTIVQAVPLERAKALLASDDRTFLRETYRLVLDREIDQHGDTAFGAQLDAGRSKLEILYDIVTSDERGNRAKVSPPQFTFECLAIKPVEGMRAKLMRLIGADPNAVHSLLGKIPILVRPIEIHIDTSEARNSAASPGHVDADSGKPAAHGVAKYAPPPRRAFKKRDEGRAMWFDLTNSMLWRSSVVGIIRSELEVAAALKKINPSVRYCMHLGNGFIEISDDQLDWLFTAENVADTYTRRLGRKIGEFDITSAHAHLGIACPENPYLFHPFEPEDIFFSMGWIDSGKEICLTKIRGQVPSLFISYLIYDIIVVGKSTKHFYPKSLQDMFDNYLNWISNHCNLICYLGKTAMRDTEAYYTERGWRTPPGRAVYFGTDFVKSPSKRSKDDLLAEMGIENPFIMTVGSIEPRKNHETLYKALLLALEKDAENTPDLVVVGRPVERVGNLIDKIQRNPRIADKVKILRPTDEQLAALYEGCLYTLLPSVYEGWSLVLAESLGRGKLSLVCKTPPLMEVGGDLVEYFEPYDVNAWADAILRYARSPALRKKHEKKVAKNWRALTWQDTAQQILSIVTDEAATLPALPPPSPEIWYDLTLTFLLWGGGLSGIPRAELVFARFLKTHHPEVHYFAYHRGAMFEIDHGMLEWLFADGDLHVQYRFFQKFWADAEANGVNFRSPFHHQSISVEGHPRNISVIPDNSIIISASIDFSVAEKRDEKSIPSQTEYFRKISSNSDKITLTQVVYDFTPLLFPHCHLPATVTGYRPFIKYISNHYDFLIYGGRTAQKDGAMIQAENGWRTPASAFIEFGSDIRASENATPERDRELLVAHGITRDFIITVGTIEPRKNHEMLYKAYLMLMERGDDLPQMIFVGKPGWLTEDFIETLKVDERVKGHIILLSPDDEFLDVLYRNCLFTLLPSMYEGWSLTLPESLSYGKFCLTADTPPLVETGRDLVEYVNPLDTMAWGERILHYCKNRRELSAWEAKIRANWRIKTWDECAHDLLKLVLDHHNYTHFNASKDKMPS